LAAILIITGFKLASPSLFKEMYARGRNMFLPFVATVGFILLTDLLIGVLIGLAVAAGFILYNNQKRPIRRIVEKRLNGDVLRIELPAQVSFLNRLALSRTLHDIPRGSDVLLDALQTDYIDPDVLDLILEFKKDIAPTRKIKFLTRGLKAYYEQVEEEPFVVDLSTRERQEDSSPEDVLEWLRAGNDRFCSGQALIRDTRQLREATARQQHPLAVIFGGTSSRAPVEVLFDVGLGDISVVRTTGNSSGEGVIGSLEYAVLVDKVKLVVLFGHTNNQAIDLAIDDVKQATLVPAEATGLGHILGSIRASAGALELKSKAGQDDDTSEIWVDRIAREHLHCAAKRLLDESAVLRAAIEVDSLGMVGCMYNVRSGRAEFFDLGQGLDPETVPRTSRSGMSQAPSKGGSSVSNEPVGHA
jgi:carbonic anhydrase/SulP family sulfate permease